MVLELLESFTEVRKRITSENNIESMLCCSIKMFQLDCNDQKCSCSDCQLCCKPMLSLICRFFFFTPTLFSSCPLNRVLKDLHVSLVPLEQSPEHKII